jgi:hypothetical protein
MRESFLILQPSECRVRDEASNLETKDVIVCCLVRAVTHLREWWYINMEQSVVE